MPVCISYIFQQSHGPSRTILLRTDKQDEQLKSQRRIPEDQAEVMREKPTNVVLLTYWLCNSNIIIKL